MDEFLSNFHKDVPISIELVKLEFPHAVNKLKATFKKIIIKRSLH